MYINKSKKIVIKIGSSLLVDEKGKPKKLWLENFIQDINVEDKRFHSRQDLPPLYCTSGAIYTRKRHLLEKFDGSDFAMGKSRKGVIMDDIEAINIDRMIDFNFAEFLLTQNISEEYIKKNA